MADIGFIGLGIMGKPMVRNLMNAGNTVTVYDIVGTSVEEMATEGAIPASSSSEVAEKNPLIITMVPDSADSEAAILGANGVLEGAASGSVVIDMSSIAPASSQKIAAGCEAQGVDFLDAPVSGGEPGAISGTLAIMVGGKKDVYDKYVDVFAPMGSATFLRRLRRGQHHEARQPDYGRHQHRGSGRGAGALQESRAGSQCGL